MLSACINCVLTKTERVKDDDVTRESDAHCSMTFTRALNSDRAGQLKLKDAWHENELRSLQKQSVCGVLTLATNALTIKQHPVLRGYFGYCTRKP